MHDTAMDAGKAFFAQYGRDDAVVIDIGSQDVNGSLRSVARCKEYVGLDFQNAKGVDIVLEDPYKFPLVDNFADLVVSSSCFEHSEFFWLTFLEAVRILKPGGHFYLNAPSRGDIHRFPVDCWRFYPDAAGALANWANRNGYNIAVVKTDTLQGPWGDFVAVFTKT